MGNREIGDSDLYKLETLNCKKKTSNPDLQFKDCLLAKQKNRPRETMNGLQNPL